MIVRALTSLIAALALGLMAAAAARAEGPPPAAPPATHAVLVLLKEPPDHFRPGADYGGAYGDQASRAARRRTAARLARGHGLTLTGDWPMPLLGLDCFIMAVPEDRTLAAAAQALSRAPGVAWSQPMNLFHGQGAAQGAGVVGHNDPLFPFQPAARAWRLADLHQIATGRNVSVAVIDSMVEANHPDLAGQVRLAENFVPGRPARAEQHGTAVAGIIAAKADNRLGIVGVAPGARLLALRACWQEGPSALPSATVCDSLSLAEALHFAIAHGAQVINLSLSGPDDPLLGRLIDVAEARGATVVGAVDADLPGGGFPASHAGVVAVTNESPSTAMAGIVSAPGRETPTTEPGGRWSLVSGSSYAAAHVSGLFALLRERDPRARTIAALAPAPGGGDSVDPCRALLRVFGPCECACAHGPGVLSMPAR